LSGALAYDSNGNTLTDAQRRSFTWDFENHLVQAVVTGQNAGTTTFKYDPFGTRIQKSGPLGTINYLYDGIGIIEELSGDGSISGKYQGAGVDQQLATVQGGTTKYYELDGLLSTTSLTDTSAAFANNYNYDGFGNVESHTGSVLNFFQYAGRELDLETGILYYRARYFDPTAGRFITEDPTGFGSGDANLYRYVFNNPIVFI
jgi:RHS repeat-associated protein